MKSKIRKLSHAILSLLIVFTSIFTVTPVLANETSENDSIDTITRLGTYEEVFGNPKARGNNPVLGELYSKVNGVDNGLGYSYVAHLYINGKTVFCIEPGVLFNESGDYPVNYTAWDDLSETQRQAIWEISYYGYNYPNHQNSRYYTATQLLIWQVVDKWYDPYTVDGSSYFDVSAEINEINRLRSQPQGRPSFHNQTIKMGLNTPVTITDSKGVLSNFAVNSTNGIKTFQSGNNLTIELTSEDYTKQAIYGRSTGNTVTDCNIIYGSAGDQKVIYLAKRTDPTPNFKLNFELLYADIQVDKQDSETGKNPQGDATFNGAVFEIRDLNGNVEQTLKTDGSSVTSKKFPVGTKHQVCEVTSPTGYLLNENCQLVDLKYEGDNTKEHFNTIIKDDVIKGRIEIAKSIPQETIQPFESVIQKPGVGYRFDIFLKSTNEKVAEMVTDDEGRAMSPYLPYGRYIVKEQSKVGYDTLPPFEVMIDEHEEVYFYNIYNDTLKAELQIYKTDAETGKRIPASDVKFKIKDEQGNFIKQTVTYPNKYETDTFVTDDKGAVHLPEALIYGKYSICEIEASYGYLLNTKELPFEVDGSTTEIYINFENAPQKAQLEIEKFGEQFVGADFIATEYGIMYSPIYENQYLDGVTYEIIAREDIVGQEGTLHYKKGEVVDTITTTKDKTSLSKLLPLGKYSIYEVSTKEGFVLDPKVYDFDFEYAGQLIEIVQDKMTFTNQRQKLDLQVKKTFENEDPNAYKDVVFGVYTKKDIKIGKETAIPKDALVGVFNLNEDGTNAQKFDLPIGDFYIKELETNIGYILDENQYDFTFEYEEPNKEFVIVSIDPIHNKKRRLDLEITKVDKDNHDIFLSGAVFEVKDVTTGKDLGILASGKLALRGTEVGEEYEIALDEKFEHIIKTVKTDEEKEIILKISEGTYYTRKVGTEEVTKHIIKDGKATLPDAIYGHEYEFKEIQSPTSYRLATSALVAKVVANRDTELVKYTFENERIKVPDTSVES